MSEAAIRVAIADDHAIVLHGLQQLFERQGGFDVVACSRNGDEALAVVRSQPVDILVLDLRMPGKSGLDVLREVSSDVPACRVVLLTAALRDAAVSEIMQAGAKGIVLKESSPEDLIDCVRRVHRGHVWIDRGLLARTFDRTGKNGEGGETVSLTPREREIIRMVAQGLRNREIGQRLFISEGTVKIHLHNVYDKLGLDGRLELLLYAQENGLI
jgi:DNA-binding NarL/FixJ family response regulator